MSDFIYVTLIAVFLFQVLPPRYRLVILPMCGGVFFGLGVDVPHVVLQAFAAFAVAYVSDDTLNRSTSQAVSRLPRGVPPL